MNSEKKKEKKGVSYGLLVIALLVAFIAGNRLQIVGDWFFAPYTNKHNQTLSQNLNFSEAEEIYDILKQKYDGELKVEELQNGLSRGLVQAVGDPYTVFLTADEADQFQDDLNGTFTGIGAELGKRNNALVIIAPITDSPAQKAGLRPGDSIIGIDEEDATDLSIDEAVARIRGEPNTQVKLTILRGTERIEFDITREQITVASVMSQILPDNIGYMKITRFSKDTAELAQKAGREFADKGVKGVIIDVRNNGGGILESPVKVAGLWLDNEVVAEQKEGERSVSTLRTSNNAVLAGVPAIVLINEGSASSSEILAGALHDHKVAQLVGEKTFGKGSVQELVNLKSGARLKVTIARWFTPNGKNIDKEGLTPDVEVEFTTEDFDAGRDPQKDQAVEILRNNR